MRTLIILLIASLCLVTAKYLPHDLSDTNLVLSRVRRSDSDDSDSNTASVERNDDSSNNNDNEDSDDNDSAEKRIDEELDKLREKEEKKKQKLLEKLEKQKQKELEEKQKLEEKLAKEQRKEQERKQKEERKLRERIEKEKLKLEEEKIKMEQKLEKEERKRQEKLKKQAEKIQKQQIESAEDSYLETEEEDSVEIEDIWKAHVYEKYGLNITSTKLERQLALQRYLRDEMGIDANSTKSERRQAILKLIETKLQNDSAAVDSFRNLLLSHVNAIQIQKLRSKLENDLEELNNQTVLLNNISLPWATVAKQNVEEKKSFLQAIAQFLSSIVPNWFSDGQSSSKLNPIKDNGSSGISANSLNSVAVQPAQPLKTSESGTVVQGVVGGESNLRVLPTNSGFESSSNSPSVPNESLSNDYLNNNVHVIQNNDNNLSSSTSDLVNSETLNSPAPINTGNLVEESGGILGSSSINSNVSVHQTDVNEQSIVTDNLAHFVPVGGFDNKPTSSNSVVPQVVNENTSVSQTSTNGLSPNAVNNSKLLNTKALTESGTTLANSVEPKDPVGSTSLNNNVSVTTDVNSPSFKSAQLSNNNLSNSLASASSNPTSSTTPYESSGTSVLENESVNNIVAEKQNGINNPSANTISGANLDSLSNSVLANSESIPRNLLALNGPTESGILNNKASVNNESSNANQLADNSSNSPSSAVAEIPSELNGSVSSDSLNTNISQTDVNELPSVTSQLPDNLSNPLALADSESTSNIPSELNGTVNSLNNNVLISQADVDRLSSNTILPIDNNSSNSPASTLLESTSIIPSELNGSVGSDLVNNNVPVSQTDLNESPSTTDHVVDETPASANSKSTSNVLPNLNGVLSTDSLSNVPISQTNVNELSSDTVQADDSSLSNSSNSPVTANSKTTLSLPSELSDSVNIDSINDNEPSQAKLDELLNHSSNPPASADFESTTNVPLEGYVTSDFKNNNVLISQTSISGLPSYIVDPVNTDIPTNSDNPIDNTTINELVSGVNNSETVDTSRSQNTFSTDPTPSNPSESNVSVLKELVNSNDENTQPESINGVIRANEVEINSSTDTGVATFSNNGTEQLNDTNAASVNNTVTIKTTVNSDSLSDVSSKDSTLNVAATSEPVTTSNFETVTDVILTNTQAISSDSFSHDSSVTNAEADITETANTGTDFLTTSANEFNDVVTPVEAETEKDILPAQEIVNTPSDVVTESSVKAPSPPPGIVVPNEAAASIVGIKLQ